jgi:hypothetical protein
MPTMGCRPAGQLSSKPLIRRSPSSAPRKQFSVGSAPPPHHCRHETSARSRRRCGPSLPCAGPIPTQPAAPAREKMCNRVGVGLAPPLPSDNFLQAHHVAHLPSPPRIPWYNGSIEASQWLTQDRNVARRPGHGPSPLLPLRRPAIGCGTVWAAAIHPLLRYSGGGLGCIGVNLVGPPPPFSADFPSKMPGSQAQDLRFSPKNRAKLTLMGLGWGLTRQFVIDRRLYRPLPSPHPEYRGREPAAPQPPGLRFTAPAGIVSRRQPRRVPAGHHRPPRHPPGSLRIRLSFVPESCELVRRIRPRFIRKFTCAHRNMSK